MIKLQYYQILELLFKVRRKKFWCHKKKVLIVLSVCVSASISKTFLSVSSQACPETIRWEGLSPDRWIDPLTGLLYDVSVRKQGEMVAGPLEEEGPRGMSPSLHPVLALCLFPASWRCLMSLPWRTITAKTNLPTYTLWPSWVFCHGDNTEAWGGPLSLRIWLGMTSLSSCG